ncbi:hypothetical protein JK628_02805 [Shewanella sp. KX20019]|uniref:hypothetical protein n=1 Tax=Shewanella sp. KX20019 TaxID=2803864 RepID=UPI001927AC92|nr:hypothetical protein [Shewanella sp. KX20019]QQX80819.1 hypothetical protein JK628_02805 [Shewanella sp. KX20019]
MKITVIKQEVGNSTKKLINTLHIDRGGTVPLVEFEPASAARFAEIINVIRDHYQVDLRQICKIFGKEGTTQDLRDMRRVITGKMRLLSGDFQLALIVVKLIEEEKNEPTKFIIK